MTDVFSAALGYTVWIEVFVFRTGGHLTLCPGFWFGFAFRDREGCRTPLWAVGLGRLRSSGISAPAKAVGEATLLALLPSLLCALSSPGPEGCGAWKALHCGSHLPPPGQASPLPGH